MSTLDSIANAPDLLAGLNAEQREAVTAPGGPILVVAGPGSGKTRVLTHRIAYLIRERGLRPDQILAVTFTNKAAREMRERIERLLGGELRGLEMGTFHAWGARLLRRHPGLVADRLGVLPSFLIYDDADQLELAKRAVQNVGLDPKQVAPRRMLSRISAAKSQLLSPREVAEQAATYDDEVIARVFAEYERSLRKANAVDFDDLLGLPIRLFDAAPDLLSHYQTKYQSILVDEYQDTNRVQYVLVTALAQQHRNLFVVGDPDQSIYGWRQADIRNILDFETDYPDARRIHLELNYRSTRRIVDAADRVIRENTQRIDRRLRTDNPDGEEVIVRELADQNHEAQFVVGEIRRLMRSQGLGPADVAVMYRTTAQSRTLEEAFRVSDIPYRIVGGVRFYERKEIKDVLAVLRLLSNPADDVSLERVIANLPLGRGLGPKALDAVRAWAALQNRPALDGFIALAPAVAQSVAPPLTGSARAAAGRLGAAFAALREARDRLTLPELFDALLERTGYKESFDQNNEEDLERWANVLELRADLERYELLDPADALPTYLEQVALIAGVDTMRDDERGAVTLITLHSAKGLEFPVVFIVGVEENLLPISRAVEVEFSDPLPLEEERRLFYVGITRAQQLLYITYVANRLSYGSYRAGVPSRFLKALFQVGTRVASRGPSRRESLQEQVRRGAGSAWPSDPAPARPAPAPPRPTAVYQPGQRVFHAKFGEGRITAVTTRPDDQELKVEFVRHGPKVLMASLAPLEIVE